MKISVSTGNNVNFMPMDVADITEVANAALEYSVSTGTFVNNNRRISNFKCADFIGLDIDQGMTIEEAKLKFSDYTHAIMPSRNHQKQKNGLICDRFRVFLQLENTIYNEKDFYETWFKLKDEFPALDPAAKDPSRQFYSCQSIEQLNVNGKRVRVQKWSPKHKKEVKTTGLKGELSKSTLKFLAMGAVRGEWNHSLYKTCKDFQQQGYTQDETLNKLSTMANSKFDGELDESDVKTITSAFNSDQKHEPRLEECKFNPTTVDTLYKRKDVKLNWLLGDLLPMGGCSLIAGPPKAGKSTLIRQLSAAVCMGTEKFLGRKVTQGKVLYLALEEQEEVLKEEYKKLGIKGNDFFVYVGSIDKPTIMKDLKYFILQNEISLVVIDTFMVFTALESANDYKETYSALTDIRNLARETNAHIMCVHHTNKSEFQGMNNIMGSNAFVGGVDVAILFKAMGERRYISSTQRPGKPFTGEPLIFDRKTNTYAIGRKKDEESRKF